MTNYVYGIQTAQQLRRLYIPPTVIFTQAFREVVNSNDRGSLPRKVVHPSSSALLLRRSIDVSLHCLKCLQYIF